MHPLFSQASGMTHDLIGAAIEVHKDKGPGLLESIYEWCLKMELELRGHLLIDKCLFVEAKAVQAIHPIHKAQLLSYMKLLDVPLGLIINFNVPRLTDAVSRLILPGSNMQ